MTSPVLMPAGHEIVAADLDAYENLTAAWATWSPTHANLTVGNGTVTAKYRQVGKTVDYRWRFTLGSTSAMATDPSFTLPATPNADYVGASFNGFPIGSVFILDSGTGGWVGLVICFSGAVGSPKYATEAGGGSISAITSTTPMTWTTADCLMAYGSFEVA